MARVALNVQTIGFDANEKPCIIAHFICDSQADLPSINAYTDNTLLIGCTAHCITEHTDHELKSGGQWVQTSTSPNADELAALIELVDSGGKNKLKNTLSSGTIRGITYTINQDGSITTNAGTATGGNSNLVIYFTLPVGKYVLSGCPNGGSGTTYRAQVIDNTISATAALVTDSTTGSEFEIIEGHDYAWRFRVQDGATISTSTFYPMICTKVDWEISQTFQPYRPSYQELYEMVLALQ